MELKEKESIELNRSLENQSALIPKRLPLGSAPQGAERVSSVLFFLCFGEGYLGNRRPFQ